MIRASLLCVAVLLTLTAPAEAAFPGKPGPVVYVKTSTEEVGDAGEVESTGGLYLDPPGRRRQPRPLTSNRTDGQPSFSPDGRRIVFVSGGAEGQGIYVMNVDGSGRRKVTEGSSPSFFPSGRAIVFSHTEGRDSHIYSVRLDGTGLRQLTRGRHNDYEPVVSLNGRRIVFVSDRDRDGRRDRSDIFSMRPNGTRVRVLIDGPRSEYEPDYAPNGKRIAFASNRRRGANIFVARADGRRVRALTRCRPFPARCASYSEPSFSPNGRQIAVRSSGSRSSSIDVIPVGRRGFGRSVDGGSIEEEGFGSRVGETAWGPRPRR